MLNRYKALIIFLLVLFSLVFIPGCKEEEDELVLRIYNCQDYIDEEEILDDDGNVIAGSVLDEWAKYHYETYGEKVTYVYDTFETLESMMNTLKTGKTTYDLVCPSDYTIQKMLNKDMLDKIDYSLGILENKKYISPYITNLFIEKGWDDYSIPYMWGTVGFIYNPEYIKEEEASSWNVLWDTKEKATAKDSIRDTYVAGVMYVYQDELNQLKQDLNDNKINVSQYNKQVQDIMNRCDDETLSKVQVALTDMKNNVYGFEVDSGKNDIVTGKIALNLAWSGDAVYSMDCAQDEEDVYLNYAVPEEGSNVWFDAWVLPKGANQKLAQSFLNYLCDPEIAVRNMNCIGYTSAVVGDEVYDMILDWYGVEEGEQGYDVDLTYLFEGSLSDDYYTEDGKVIVTINERGRQFDAQYPDLEVISRCGIMEDFGDQNNAVIAMWENVKMGDIPSWITVSLVISVLAILGILYGRKLFIKVQREKRKQRLQALK